MWHESGDVICSSESNKKVYVISKLNVCFFVFFSVWNFYSQFLKELQEPVAHFAFIC